MWYGFGSYSLALGDCIEAMQQIPPDTVDAVVTDPPYAINFMGRGWDDFARTEDYTERDGYKNKGILAGYGRGGPTEDRVVYRARAAQNFQPWMEERARALLRVAKPGAHVAAFGGSRTHHRLFSAFEDAGWEVRDCLFWCYGQGFPKNRVVEGGRGTALKPAVEPICLARKPFRGPVEANVARWGTGALNIDLCRIPSIGGSTAEARRAEASANVRGAGATSLSPLGGPRGGDARGRHPANLLLDEHTAARLDAQAGVLKSGAVALGAKRRNLDPSKVFADEGGASRFFFQTDYEHELLELEVFDPFFYCAKASRKEREIGLEHLPAQIVNDGRKTSIDNPYQRGDTLRRNTHPAVKPIKLLRWLVRLITPHGGLVLDPFMGSGSTGCACALEGVRFMGVDNHEPYLPIAQARIDWWSQPVNRSAAERIAA